MRLATWPSAGRVDAISRSSTTMTCSFLSASSKQSRSSKRHLSSVSFSLEFGIINAQRRCVTLDPKVFARWRECNPRRSWCSRCFIAIGDGSQHAHLTVRAEWLAEALAYLEIRRCDNDAIFNAQLAALGAPFTQVARSVLRLFGATPHHASMSKGSEGASCRPPREFNNTEKLA